VIIVLIDWRLTLLIMMLVPLIILLATFFGRRFRGLSRAVQELLALAGRYARLYNRQFSEQLA